MSPISVESFLQWCSLDCLTANSALIRDESPSSFFHAMQRRSRTKIDETAVESFMSAKLKVLIAEDNFMIADMAEDVLVHRDYEVCGIAATVEEAVALGLRHKPDLALIDFRLADGGFGTEVATRLRAVGRIGVLFATGNSANAAMQDAEGDACLGKPYQTEDLVRGLEIVAEIAATGAAAPPFPRGLQLLRRAYSKPAEYDYG
jgi:CheY-like chemotaxis protein